MTLMSSAVRRCFLFVSVAMLPASQALGAQIDAIRKAREQLRLPAPSLERLFGGGPAITSTLADATEAVPSLDGFTPEVLASMSLMPRGPGGTYLIAPGAYTFIARSFCLRPGTYGPRAGGGGFGYLYAPLKGPRANVVNALVQRSADHPEIAQYDVQLLLWAVTVRAKLSAMPSAYQRTAAQLLTPAELADLEGVSLSVVPAELGQRVLRDAPPALRPILQAENELRRIVTSTSIAFADAERVAVLSGVDPDATGAVPVGRWSYHPGGYFIRYKPLHYSATVVEVYYPEAFELTRDALGRITSVSIPDRRFDAVYEQSPIVSHASFSPLRSATPGGSRLRAVRYIARAAGGEVRITVSLGEHAVVPRAEPGDPGSSGAISLVQLQALADVADLAALREAIANEQGQNVADVRKLLREAEHGALARYHALATRYDAEPGMQVGGMKSFGGNGGAAMPGGTNKQIVGVSGGPAGGKGGAGASGGYDDLTSAKARKASEAMGRFSTIASALAGPAAFIGGFLPSLLLGEGIDAAHAKADKIFDALGGNPGGDDGPDAESEGPISEDLMPDDAATNAGASSSPQGADYATFFQPRQVSLPRIPAANGLSAERAETVNGMLEATYRVATTLEAVAEASRRRRSAIKAGDQEWEQRQGRAEIHMKREAGQALVDLSQSLSALQAGGPLKPDVNDIREGQGLVRTEAIPTEALALNRALGRTDAQLAEYRNRVLALDAREVATTFHARLRELREALKAYGDLLSALPTVPAPW